VDSEVADSDYYSPPGEAYGEATQLYKSVFRGTTAVVEGPLKDSYGDWVSGLAPVVDAHTGKAVSVVGMDIDASDYRRTIGASASIPVLISLLFLLVISVYEWNRLRQKRELQVRSELMSIASHELRTPITGIRWATESLLRTQADGPTKSILQAMSDSILNLQSGTEDILQLTRLQKNPKLQPAPTDLVALVAEICQTHRIVANEKQVTIAMDESWPKSLVLHCDPSRMKQVFHNLVANAVKYAKPNTAVTLSYMRDSKHHKIMVVDQGIGIPASEQSRVFEGFYRASNAKALGEPGTGLGLYLTKTIMHQHHGKVSFVSTENKGTTFTISLPVGKG
jgi:two-component system, sensor histidine kinase